MLHGTTFPPVWFSQSDVDPLPTNQDQPSPAAPFFLGSPRDSPVTLQRFLCLQSDVFSSIALVANALFEQEPLPEAASFPIRILASSCPAMSAPNPTSLITWPSAIGTLPQEIQSLFGAGVLALGLVQCAQILPTCAWNSCPRGRFFLFLGINPFLSHCSSESRDLACLISVLFLRRTGGPTRGFFLHNGGC